MRKTLIALLTLVTFTGYGQRIKINTERLSENWRILQSFGFNEATQGNERIAFSDYNLDAVNMIDEKLTALGMQRKNRCRRKFNCYTRWKKQPTPSNCLWVSCRLCAQWRAL